MKIERTNLFSCSGLPEKEKRNLAIFELIRTKGRISKPEISKATGINIVSVSNYVENYIAKKLIAERESSVSSGGRKPELVELSGSDRLVGGVEVGRDAIRAVVTDLRTKAAGKSEPVTVKTGDNAAAAGTALREASQRAGTAPDGLAAIGMAVEEERLFPVGAALGKATGVPVFVGGMAQAATYGERTLNKAIAADDMLYLYSDLGKGVVLTGCTCYGAAGAVDGDGEYEEELKYLEPWDPALGVVHMARAQVLRGIGTKIVACARGGVDGISVESVVAAARQKDRVASDILRMVGLNLGVRVAFLVNLFSPAAVVIGGGIEQAGPLILDPIGNMVKRFSYVKQAKRVKVLASALGDDAVSLGAASLAVREMFVRA